MQTASRNFFSLCHRENVDLIFEPEFLDMTSGAGVICPIIVLFLCPGEDKRWPDGAKKALFECIRT